ncbi:MAG: HepT-like ribonuclease domain-containing protein [Promethearchaeota archaeon]
MKSLRNILVHRYGKIQDGIVFEILIERLDDFSEIEEIIINILKVNEIK